MAETKSIFDSDYGSELQQGQAVVCVRDKRLAACLIAVGIQLRKDPPYVQISRKDGTIQTTFNFYPSDDEGVLQTTDMVGAWGQDLDFIKENPMHPFTFAMCAIRNYQDILDHLKRDTPYVAFRTKQNGRSATVMVKKGSRKHKAAENRGLKQL